MNNTNATNDTVEILPYRGWERPNLAELLEYRFLLETVILRNITRQYRQTMLGPIWFVLTPLFRMVLFSVLLGFVAGLPSEGVPYPVYTYTALLPWELFRRSATDSMQSLTSYIRIISRIDFPRLILPLSAALTAGVYFVISFGILLLLALLYGFPPSFRLLYSIPLTLLAMGFGLGVGMLLSGLQVRYRDTSNFFDYVLQIWMYVTPVAYSSTAISDRLPPWAELLYELNPMNAIVEGFRWAVIARGQPPAWPIFATVLATCGVLYVGARVFMKTEHSIIDLI